MTCFSSMHINNHAKIFETCFRITKKRKIGTSPYTITQKHVAICLHGWSCANRSSILNSASYLAFSISLENQTSK